MLSHLGVNLKQQGKGAVGRRPAGSRPRMRHPGFWTRIQLRGRLIGSKHWKINFLLFRNFIYHTGANLKRRERLEKGRRTAVCRPVRAHPSPRTRCGLHGGLRKKKVGNMLFHLDANLKQRLPRVSGRQPAGCRPRRLHPGYWTQRQTEDPLGGPPCGRLGDTSRGQRCSSSGRWLMINLTSGLNRGKDLY